MTLLTICQNAMAEAGLDYPLAITSSTTPDGRQLLALANRIGEELARINSWNYMIREGSITLVEGQQSYSFPADLLYMIPDTTWDTDQRRPVDIPMSPEIWSVYRGWQWIAGLNLRARIDRNGMTFDQEITADYAGNNITFMYRSAYWVLDNDGVTYKPKFDEDSDTTLHDESLMTLGVRYYIKLQRGLDFQFDMQQYQTALRLAMSGEKVGKSISLSRKARYPTVNIPDWNYPS